MSERDKPQAAEEEHHKLPKIMSCTVATTSRRPIVETMIFAEKAARRRGAPRRSVSEVRTPRPFPMPSPPTDDEPGPGERIEGGAASPSSR